MFGSISVALVGLLAATSAMPTPGAGAIDVRPESPDIVAITSVDPSTFTSYQTGGLVRYNADINSGKLVRRDCATSATFTWGDDDSGGQGLLITNGGSDYYGFYIYANSCDYIPYKYIWIAGGSTEFVSLYAGFQGRVTRGTDAMNLAGSPQLLGTWFEISWDSNGAIWGDVSLIRGCDGGVLIWSTDGSGSWKGFTQDILANAPSGAWAQKSDGTWVLAPTEGDAAGLTTDAYELTAVGPEYAYIDDAHGNPTISSSNGRFGVYFDPGTI